MGMEHLYLGKMVGDRFHTNWCIENWNQEECSCKRYGLDTADLEQEAKEYREGMLEWAVIKAKVESELEDIEPKGATRVILFSMMVILGIWTIIELLKLWR